MTYQESLDFLYTQLPQFQRIGAAAYKPGLSRVIQLSEQFGNPHEQFKSIHVGGTNGKGSTSSMIAAVLQSSGYKVGLYTSPHLVDFRERIRINGDMIPQDAVVDFVDRWQRLRNELPDIEPSFFELTMIMAFEYFACEKVDVAVVEVGLGGRLDSTNIITPKLSITTNISKDHTQFLGNTLPQIAAEKAGIIKPKVPVVIGEAEGKIRTLFTDVARSNESPIYFATDTLWFTSAQHTPEAIIYHNTPWGDLSCPLTGVYQPLNAATVMSALDVLTRQGWRISPRAVAQGFANVDKLTGLMGRWTTIAHDPTTIIDTGHNVGGWEYLGPKLASYGSKLRMVIGFVADKDIDSIMALMPRKATYYFTQADIPRALTADKVAEKGVSFGLHGRVFSSVADALQAARNEAATDEVVFVGGSTFVAGEAIQSI